MIEIVLVVLVIIALLEYGLGAVIGLIMMFFFGVVAIGSAVLLSFALIGNGVDPSLILAGWCFGFVALGLVCIVSLDNKIKK